jgi:hypothetical protein
VQVAPITAVRRPRCLTILAGCLCALPLAITSLPARADTAALVVRAVVKEFFAVQAGPAAATFEVTEQDVTRGYADAQSNVEVEVRTNSGRDLVVHLQPSAQAEAFSLQAAGAAGTPRGEALRWKLTGAGRVRRESIRVLARMHLAPSSQPGLYRMQLQVEVTPL